MELLHCTAALPGGSGQCNPCNALPCRLGAVGFATPAIHCLTTRGQWAMQLLSRTASLPRGIGQWNSCNTLPACLPAVEEEEEEEERLPRSHGQWALESSPVGPAQTSQGSPPFYLRKSKTDLAAHLVTLFLGGHPGLSAGERQRYGPICLQVPVTDHLKVLDAPHSASQNSPSLEGVGPPGASPPT